jgi:hypothetical protein
MAQVLVHAAELYLLEQAAVAAVAGPVRAAVRSLLGRFSRRWIAMFGSTTTAADPLRLRSYLTDLQGDLKQLPGRLQRSPAQVLLEHALDALDLGVHQAADEVALDVDVESAIDRGLSDDVLAAIGELDDAITAKLDAAARAAERFEDDRFEQVLTQILAPAQQAATTAERTTTWVENKAANDGIASVAGDLLAPLLWVAERDACVHCLGLSGEVSADGAFDGTKTFGKKPLAVWPGPDLTGPPRHPNCRCRVQPWLGTEATEVDFPAALKREAARSILTGWRLPSESEHVRLDAAERLLQRGTTLPASVQARARAAVKRRRFATFPRIKTTTR